MQREDEVNAIIAFHAGPQDLTPGNWCRQADRVGLRLFGIQVASGGGLLGSCVNAGFSTVPDDGEGLEQVFEAVGTSLFQGDRIDRIVITDDMMARYIEYVPGSSSPVEPTAPFGGNLEWELPGGDNPPGGRALTYRIAFEEGPGLAPDQLQVSREARAYVQYASGMQWMFPLHLPTICLARPGMLAQDCGGYETPTPTPSATPDLPTAEPSETPKPGSETVTPFPTTTAGPTTPIPSAVPTTTPSPSTTPTPPPSEMPTVVVDPAPPVYLPLLLRDATPLPPGRGLAGCPPPRQICAPCPGCTATPVPLQGTPTVCPICRSR